ncbi:MAG: hypothetical protein R3D03_01485 [Geminicoccaceae bacterium]
MRFDEATTLADLAVGIGTGRIEIAKGSIPQAIGHRMVGEDPFDHQL